MERRVIGTRQVWPKPFTELRVPKIVNLHTDPHECADHTSNTYWDWMLDHGFLLVSAQALVAQMARASWDSPFAEARDLRYHPGVGQDAGRSAERMSESRLGSPTAAGEPPVGDMVWLPAAHSAWDRTRIAPRPGRHGRLPDVRVREAGSGLVGGDSGNVERQVGDLVVGEGRTEA